MKLSLSKEVISVCSPRAMFVPPQRPSMPTTGTACRYNCRRLKFQTGSPMPGPRLSQLPTKLLPLPANACSE